MKRTIFWIYSLGLCLFSLSIHADVVSQSGDRLWEIIEKTDDSLKTTDSKLDLIDNNVNTAFAGTFTALQAVIDKSCSIESKVEIIDNDIVVLNERVLSICDQIEIIDTLLETNISKLDEIRIDDFGGTWTAIEGIESDLCSKFEIIFESLEIIDSKIDVFSSQEYSHYIDTFTTIEGIADDVLDTLTFIEQISIDTSSRLDIIDSLLFILKNNATTISSKLDLLDINVDVDFQGTFTALQASLDKLCLIESSIDILANGNDFTLIELILSKVCVVDSKIDITDECLSALDDQIMTIESSSDILVSKVCLIESTVDQLGVIIETIGSKADIIIDSSCTIESKTDLLQDGTALSKICIVESKLDIIHSDVQVFETSIEVLSSQIDSALGAVCTTASNLDIICDCLVTNTNRPAAPAGYELITSQFIGSDITTIDWSADDSNVIFGTDPAATNVATFYSYLFDGSALTFADATSTSIFNMNQYVSCVRFRPSNPLQFAMTGFKNGGAGANWDMAVWSITALGVLSNGSFPLSGVDDNQVSTCSWRPQGDFLLTGGPRAREGVLYSVTGAGIISSVGQINPGGQNDMRAVEWDSSGLYVATGQVTIDAFRVWLFNGVSSFSEEDVVTLNGDVNTLGWNSVYTDRIVVGTVATSSNLRVYEFNTGTSSLTELENISTGANVNAVQWHPDGDRVLVGMDTGAGDELLVYSWDNDTSSLSLEKSISIGDSVLSVRWGTDGSYIAAGTAGANGTLYIYGGLPTSNCFGLESKVQALDSEIFSLESKVDIDLSTIEIISSKISEIDLIGALSKVCTMDSKLDGLDASISIIDQLSITVGSKVEILYDVGQTISSFIDISKEAASEIDVRLETIVSGCNLTLLTSTGVLNPVRTLDWSFDDGQVAVSYGTGVSSTLNTYLFNQTTLTAVTPIPISEFTDFRDIRWHPTSNFFALGRVGGLFADGLRIYSATTTSFTQVDSGNTNRPTTSVAWNYQKPSYVATGIEGFTGTSELIVDTVSSGMITASYTKGIVGNTAEPSRAALDWNQAGDYLALGLAASSGANLRVFAFSEAPVTLTDNAAEIVSTVNAVTAVGWNQINTDILAVGTAGTTGNLRIYQHNAGAGTLTQLDSLDLGATVQSVHWHPTRQLVAVGLATGAGDELRLYSYSPDDMRLRLQDSISLATGINVVRWSRSGDYLAVGADDDTIYVYEFSSDLLATVCSIESRLDAVASKIDINETCLNIFSSRIDELTIDFTETWTALQVLQDKACTVESTTITIESKIDILHLVVDLSSTITALTALQDKVCNLEVNTEVSISYLDLVECTSTADFDGTYTMIVAMEDKADTISSIIDVLLLDLADINDNFGIPIFQSDVGTTGTFLDIPGRYYLAENINFEPESEGLAAITFDVRNIEFLMLRRTIRQVGTVNSTAGLRISEGIIGIDIEQGSIIGFTGNAIEGQQSVGDIFVRGVNIKNITGNGIDFDQSCTTIVIEEAMIASCGGDGINFDASSDIFVRDCMITDNGLSTTNNGVTVSSCNRVRLSHCMTTTNAGNGYSFTSTSTAVHVVLEDCKAFENDMNGIFMSHVFEGVIQECVCAQNGADGIRVNDCSSLEIVQNFCMENTDDGIVLGIESVGTNDCYIAENSLMTTGSVNLREESGSGPNSILSNFALSVNSGDNYVTESGKTYLNFVTIDQSGSFPSPEPVKWHNISMTT